MQRLPFLLFIVSMACSNNAAGQAISGYVLDEQNQPIPFVHVFVKQLEDGTISDANGRYFINLTNGVYDIVFSSVGFETKSMEVIIGEETVQKNVWMEPSNVQLNEVVVSARRKDPAYEIIQNVIKNKKKHLSQLSSFQCHVYVKATEVIDVKKKVKKRANPLQGEDILNPFPEEGKEAPNINMLEMDLVLHYQYPGNYKEERTAVKTYGTKAGLFVPRFDETDFNFYRNLVELKNIAEAPVISPVSRTSILSYKYSLESIDTIDQVVVYGIKVTPRKSGNSTCEGFIYINDGTWNINRLDFTFHKGGLKVYDHFRLKQQYEMINETLWVVTRQEFIYGSKQGKLKKFNGNTTIRQTDFQLNLDFENKFFNNEIVVTKKEAFDKDSSYWNSTRPEPLTLEEQEMVTYRDSVHAHINSIEYKDSVEERYNRVTLGDLTFDGVGFRDHRKKRQYYFSSLFNSVGFEVIGGWRVNPYGFYFKRWESGKILSTSVSPSMGFKNSDFQGALQSYFLYDPFKIASLQLTTGRSFYSINPQDAYLNQIKRSNYILVDRFGLTHRREFINGLYLTTGFDYAERQSVESYDSETVIGRFLDDEEPLSFEDYQSLITEVRLSYTPKQRYMTEPSRKVVLGSNFPTFSIMHRKGWNGPFSSDIDFDYLEFMIRQKVTLGVFGNSEYTLQTGKFFNTRDLRIVDEKRFRQSDPFLYSDPLISFQLLDTALIANDPYFEAHHIHHFNGALINNIPLIKKLRFRMVAGAGILWVQESNYRHEELFVGTERVFKMGARRRLRIGIYGVVANSNQTPFSSDFKISFDIIDTWKRDWSY